MLVASGNCALEHQVVAAKSDESLLESKGLNQRFPIYVICGVSHTSHLVFIRLS